MTNNERIHMNDLSISMLYALDSYQHPNTKTQTMISPYSNKPMQLRFRSETMTLKGETFPVTAIYYYCTETDQEFTTTELDTLTLYQVYQQYAEKHGLPLDEIMPKDKEKP